uniref:Uncharacterized protein n=1 Tax=Ixodes ricinus TaxID=34613 RepID=A0A6B0UGH4_IXORI
MDTFFFFFGFVFSHLIPGFAACRMKLRLGICRCCCKLLLLIYKLSWTVNFNLWVKVCLSSQFLLRKHTFEENISEYVITMIFWMCKYLFCSLSSIYVVDWECWSD